MSIQGKHLRLGFFHLDTTESTMFGLHLLKFLLYLILHLCKIHLLWLLFLNEWICRNCLLSLYLWAWNMNTLGQFHCFRGYLWVTIIIFIIYCFFIFFLDSGVFLQKLAKFVLLIKSLIIMTLHLIDPMVLSLALQGRVVLKTSKMP